MTDKEIFSSMTDKDDIMIGKFFEQASKQEIDDNGFTSRLMCQVAPRPNWAYRLWTAACLVAIVVFAVVGGMPQLVLAYVEAAVHIAAVNPELVIASLPLAYVAYVAAVAFGSYRALEKV